MARPRKRELDYFPFQCNFFHSKKVRRVVLKHGPEAVTLMIRIYCEAYSANGYWCKVDEDQIGFWRQDCGFKSDINVAETIQKLINCRVFDAFLFEKHQILTSKGIQEQYLEVIGRRKMEGISLYYWLLQQKPNGNPTIIPHEPDGNPAERGERKEKKIKLNSAETAHLNFEKLKSAYEKFGIDPNKFDDALKGKAPEGVA